MVLPVRRSSATVCEVLAWSKTSIEVEAVKPEVSDEKIEEAVDAERKRHSLLEPVEDGEVEKSDIVVIDFVARSGDDKIADFKAAISGAGTGKSSPR